jgi:hypothetical protein
MPSQDNEQNALNRRHFLRISALGSLALHPAISWAGRFIGQRDAFSGNHLGLIGAYAPGSGSFGPKGMHLRWLFPLERGFPNFFRVFRRAAFEAPYSKNMLPGTVVADGGFRQTSGAMPFSVQADIQGRLQFTSDCFVPGNQSPGRYMQFLLERPVRRFLINLENAKPVRVHAYSDSGQLIEMIHPAGVKQISLFHEGITRVGIELVFDKISEITCAETSNMISDTWQRISDKDLLVYNTSNLALPDFSLHISELANYRNYYNNGGSAYRTKLSGLSGSYRKLLEALKQKEILPAGSQSVFVDLTKPYHELELLTGVNVNQPKFYPLQWLLWAATDPNIARLLQLYFVDLKAAEGTFYAYKVEAHYSGGVILSGVLDAVQARAAENNATRYRFGAIENPGIVTRESASVEPQILASNSIPADQFVGRATARISLTKTPNAADLNDSILLLLTRVSGTENTILGDKRPIFPSEEAMAGIKPVYSDYGLTPDTPTSYSAQGIDLFGVLQNPVNSGSITVSDTIAPPPPRRLNTTQRDGKTFLQFMFGGSEYLAAPDIKQFDLHSSTALGRGDSHKFEVLQVGGRPFVTESNGNRIYTLQCKGLNSLSGLPRSGTIRLTHGLDSKPLPPSRRLSFNNFQLRLHTDNTVLIRIQTGHPGLELPATGALRMEAASDDPSFWGNARSSQAFNSPLGFRLTSSRGYNRPGTLGNADTVFTCRVLHRRVITPEMGIDRISGRKLNNQNLVELYLDRPLLAPGIFKGSLVGTDLSVTTPVMEQFSGSVITASQIALLNNKPETQLHCTRIWVTASSALTVNNQLRFFPVLPQVNLEAGMVESANPVQGMMRLLMSNAANPNTSNSINGGEMFVWGRYLRAVPNTAPTAFNSDLLPLSLELLSDVYALGNGNYEALVQCPKEILELVPNQKARFFPLNEIDISALVGGTVPGTAGKLDTYFALRSRDQKDNAGRMSKAMQVTQLRPRPAAPGPMPRFCGTAQGTDQQAPLPDQSNHAMVCLEWDNAGTGMRYEIARASGSAIINQHRTLWYLNPTAFNLETLFNDLPANPPTQVAFSTLSGLNNAPSGTHRLRLSTNSLNNLVGGRLVQGNAIYQILQAEAATDNLSTCLVVVRCKTQPITAPSGSTMQLDRDPPYHLIHRDSAKLRRLADISNTPEARTIMEQAFALLHSTSLNTPGYTDRMPASGTDRFFYKVRVVDAAENRGPWSAAGGAALQLDMRAPETPTYLSAFALHREAMFVLPRKVLPAGGDPPLRWKLERAQGSSILSNYSKIIEAGQLLAKTYFASGRMMVISQPEQLRLTLGSNPAEDPAFILNNVLVNRLVTGNNNPVPVPTDSYKIGFKVLQTGGNQRMAEINSIRFLDPQDGRDRFTIRLGTQTFSEEPAFACFPDALPAQNESFTFNIQAAKSIGGGRFIPSDKATLKTDSLDLSRPVATATRVNTDVNGSVSGQPANPYTTQLRIASAVGLTIQITKTLRSPNKVLNTRFSPNAAGTGAFPGEERIMLQPVNGQITLNDLQLNQPATGIYDYQLIIRGLNEVPMLPITL